MAAELRTPMRVWSPPALLPPPSRGSGARLLRRIWRAALVATVLIQLVGLGYVLFDAYRVNPAFRAVGLATELGDVGSIAKPIRADTVAAGVKPGARIIGIGDRTYSPDASDFALARGLLRTGGDLVPLRFRNADGSVASARISRTSRAGPAVPPNPIPVNLRMAVRLVTTLLCSLALLGSSWLLLRHRPDDPEAALFGLAILGIAVAADPPLLMWMSLNAGWVINVASAVWWPMLVIALAAFPDGRFAPRWLRWTLPVAPVLGLVLSTDRLNQWLLLVIGVAVPLAVLGIQAARFRRLPDGPERQQMKWAALGFGAGFVLLGVALAMSLTPYDGWSPGWEAGWLLTAVCLFNLAFAAMPLGLLVGLTRFRLWDVDSVISRSAAYAVATGAVALLWAAASDLVKQVVAWIVGAEHPVIALTVGAALAAGVFGPTQKRAVAWSKRRFDPSRVDLERLPERLRVWREHCDPADLAARALDVVARAVHAPAAAVLAREPTGRALLASRGLEEGQAAGRPWADWSGAGGRIVHLEDRDGLAGWLVLAPRGDGSRYSRADTEALGRLAEPIAAALRRAGRGRPESQVISLLDEVQSRLARLEQGPARA